MLSLSGIAVSEELEDQSLQQATVTVEATPEIVVTAKKVDAEADPQLSDADAQGAVQNAVLADLAGRLSRNVEYRDAFWED